MLTISFRRADLTAFWILTTVILALTLGLAATALGASRPWVWGAAGLSVLLPGLVWPQWFEIGVRAWNKGVSLSAAALRPYVLRVCYYLLFAAVSRTGSSLDLVVGAPEVSHWIARSRHNPPVGDGVSAAGADEWWGHGLLVFARSPGKAWVVFLLPVVLLLRLLRDEEQESALPSSTYTLY